MTTEPQKTVGQIFDERGPCALMAAVVELAEARKRIPFGHWIVDLGEKYQLEVNGTREEVNGIGPWESMIRREGLPVASFNTVDGVVVGGPGTEDRLIELVKRAAQEDRP